MPEVIQVQAHELCAWGICLFALGFLFRSMVLWAAIRAIVTLKRRADRTAALLADSDFWIDQILNLPGCREANRVHPGSMRGVSNKVEG
jgi:hypothetical protein